LSTKAKDSSLVYIHYRVLVGTCDLRTLWSPPVSLNLVHVLVFFWNFYLFLLLFCILKIKCLFLFIWMQVWSLEKEDI
jgi:hypothetical protein